MTLLRAGITGTGSLLGDILRPMGQILTPWSPSVLDETIEWFDPSDIGSLYQDAEMTIPVVSDGDPVGAMAGQMGISNFLQTSADRRPTFREASGVRWIEGDGVDDNMTAAIPTIPQAYHVTMAASIEFIGTGAQQTILTLPASIKIAAFVKIDAGTALTTSGITIEAGIPYVLTAQFNGENSLIRIDGIPRASGNAGINQASGNAQLFGISGACKAQFFGMSISEAVSPAFRTMIEEFWGEKK